MIKNFPEIDHVPQIGSIVNVPYYNKIVRMEVVEISYNLKGSEYVAFAELHIPKHSNMTIRDWENYLNGIMDNASQ